MTRFLRRVPFPETPVQVKACLDLAETGTIIVERGSEPAVAIMPVEDYERLSALDRLADVNEAVAAANRDASDPAR